METQCPPEPEFDWGQLTPLLPTSCIQRENILDTIDQILESADLVLLDGKEGQGKTTTAALFALRHRTSSLYLPLQSSSRWRHDPVMATSELGLQISRLIGKPVTPDPELSESTYSSLMLQLRRWQINHRKTLYFVVDGVFEIPHSDLADARRIWLLLPFGVTGCKFLVTRPSENSLQLQLPPKTKETTLPLLTPEESYLFLNDLKLSQQETEQLRRTSRGGPDWLAAIRRLVLSGTSTESLFDQVTKGLGLFELEWRVVENLDPKVRLALAVLAHDGRKYSATDLARLV